METQPTQPTRSGAARPGDGDGEPRGTAMARGLGWFSIGLGVAELAAPRQLAELIGVDEDRRTRGTLRAMGAREIAQGIILLTQPRPAWMWTRVAGDLVDLALLGWALRRRPRRSERLAAAIASVLAVTALDVVAARRLQRSTTLPARRPVARSITINRPAEAIYELWRDFEQLPRFMSNLESVRVLGDGRSHWQVKAPAGVSVGWDAEIIEDEPGRRIAWRSLPGADVDNRGRVTFRPAPGGRGTEVHVELLYHAPAGKLGVAVARLFGREPGQEIESDLRRLKQVLEVGEVVHSDASIHRRPHPARPSHRIGARP